MQRTFVWLFILALMVLLVGCVGDYIDSRLNTVYWKGGENHWQKDDSFFVVDLHADTMLWDRDFLEESDHGHVDLPRLVQGNVAIQVFAMVTKTPGKGPPPDGARLIDGAVECVPADGVNTVGLLQFAQMRPLKNWFDLKARALDQADRLKAFIKESKDRADLARTETGAPTPYMMLITSVNDLAALIKLRKIDGEPVIGAVIALEGAHWIGGEDGENSDAGRDQAIRQAVRELYEADFRMLAPTHRFNNALGASSEGCDQKAGLTADGKVFLDAVADQSMIPDMAHASEQSVTDAAQLRVPFVISHTGIRGVCVPSAGCVIERGISDEKIRATARAGGIIGIGYWPEAVGTGMDRIVNAFSYALDVLSAPDFVDERLAHAPTYDPAAHLALGSDYDGAVSVPFHTGHISLLTKALADRKDAHGRPRFSEDTLRKIIGANACRVLASHLPGGSPDRAKEVCDGL